MSSVLNIVNENELQEVDKEAINEQINSIISRHKGNRYEINKLVFESVSALTVSENYSDELASQGVLKRFWGGITGKNKKLQNKINTSLRVAQYTSQQTLQKLAEQNLMSFELITAVNNKLNSSIIEIETEINNIYGTLVTFFKKTKSDIIQLENRVERLERNVNLLNWQNSIEYQMWNGIEYTELDDVSKVVCLTRDFYDITKGRWTTSDLLLLKTAMTDIGVPPKACINYMTFIKSVSENTELLNKLFEDICIVGMEQYPEYVAISAGIQKNQLLESDEKYIVDNTLDIIRNYGCEASVSEIRDRLLVSYGRDRGKFNIISEVSAYDFILELLYNMEQVKEIRYVKTLDEKMKEAELLFSVYDTEKLIPILNELVCYGYSKAKYMLALLYYDGCSEIEADEIKFRELIKESAKEGYLPSFVMSVLTVSDDDDYVEWKTLMIDNWENLKKMAKYDVFAAYALAKLSFIYEDLEIGESDYSLAIKSVENIPSFLKCYFMAQLYDEGLGVEENYQKSFELYKISAEYGYNPAEYEVGRALIEGFGCEKNLKEGFMYYKRAMEHGSLEAINNVALCYAAGNGIYRDDKKAFELFMQGAEKGVKSCISNVGWSYRYGRGVEKNYMKAIEYYKNADNGHSNRSIGEMYLKGEGVQKDKDMAKKYLQRAVEKEDEEAERILAENF